jgi:hypothetical protein
MVTKQEACRMQSDCPHAIESAELAVKKVFAILGVDIDSPKEIEEFRQNLRFGAVMKRATDRGILAIAAAIGVAIMAAIWAGIVQAVHK